MFEDGVFFTGCNYWASHAGTNMWKDWRPDIVENDLRLLSEANIKTLRVFPLWPDFQPISLVYGNSSDICYGEERVPFTKEGVAGVSETMINRFEHFCDTAEKYNIKLIVGILTGWMSGRIFVPPFLERRNLVTDPVAVRWELKYVKYMVEHFKDYKAIVAWDLGNECNCLGDIGDRDRAYWWVSTITGAIKSIDNVRPVISGMHATFPERAYNPKDLGEILDVLCTHPYPMFTPLCDTDPLTENKSVMHAVAETVMYRGWSGKPAFVEEAGSLGPMIASDKNVGAYVNTMLYLLWSHNCHGMLWWCAFDQTELNHAPYDWLAVERELGLFKSDYSAKPVLNAITAFTDFLDNFEYDRLPKRIVDGVCISTQRNGTWGPAFGAFMLSKQAGIDIEFCNITDEIPKSNMYIIPSIGEIPKHVLVDIMKNVENGSVLYVSVDDGMLQPLNEYFGINISYRNKVSKPIDISVEDEIIHMCPRYRYSTEVTTAKALATDDKGNVVMTENKYGKGTVYFMAYPIEIDASHKPCVISGDEETHFYKFYHKMLKHRNNQKSVICNNPHISYTEHIVDESTRIVVAINCVPHESFGEFKFDCFELSRVFNNNQCCEITNGEFGVSVNMKPNTAVVFEIKLKN